MHQATSVFLIAIGLLMVSQQSAWAYIGPGAGISAIGTVVALLGALALIILGFVWYPLKRLRQKLKASGGSGESGRP